MRTVYRWASIYLASLLGLTAFGYYNFSQGQRLQALLDQEGELTSREVRFMRERYGLISPLAVREWAEANGYVPMSLAAWAEGRP